MIRILRATRSFHPVRQLCRSSHSAARAKSSAAAIGSRNNDGHGGVLLPAPASAAATLSEPASASLSTSAVEPSIPAPASIATSFLLQPLRRTGKAYTDAHARRPYLLQIMSAMITYFLGDAAAQYIQSSGPTPPPSNRPSNALDANSAVDSSRYDLDRGLRTTAIGASIAVPAYLWFNYLGSVRIPLPPAVTRALPPRALFPLTITLKILFNQFTFAALFGFWFFSWQSILSNVMAPGGMERLASGEVLSDAVERVKRTVPQSWTNSWKVWPAVTAVNLMFVPPHSRNLVAGATGMAWQTYLSILNQRAARAELDLGAGKA